MPPEPPLAATARPDEAATRIETTGSECVTQARGVLGFHEDIDVPPSLGTRYQVKETLGGGGMGEVRLTLDTYIGRDVAMKTILGGAGAPPELRARFLREARVQGRLEHPSIVPVYDLNQAPDGTRFFTMRRVQGETLQSILAQVAAGDTRATNMYSEHTLLSAFARVCLTLDYAHKQDVVHRDVKPANIMLGEFGEVYVLDWGIAKIDSGRIENVDVESMVTAQGTLLGTPGYMAPEQLLGHADLVDARADIFALGAVLFEILARRPLIPTEGGRSEMSKRTLIGVDARISHRVPEAVVPPELEAVCVRATHREPELRFQTARELFEAVDGFLAGHRDVELRRELASARLAEAQRLCEVALAEGGTDADRTEVLHRVGQVLALEPENEEAQKLLAAIMTTPARTMPAEVARRVHEQSMQALERAYATGTLVAFSVAFGAVLPAFAFMGIANPTMATVVFLAWIFAALAHYVSYKRVIRVPYATFFMLAAVASTSLLCGSLIIVPTAAATVLMVALSTAHRRSRGVIVAGAFLAVLGPWLLEVMGVLPTAYGYESDMLIIMPRAIHFPPRASKALLVVVQILPMAAVTAFTLVTRRAMDRASVRELMMLWHLKRLVPGAFSTEETLRRRRPGHGDRDDVISRP